MNHIHHNMRILVANLDTRNGYLITFGTFADCLIDRLRSL
jgi:hypothetical protein